ncbi:D-arabinono-1,4-lactone oxidase [Vibrio penaeicida]|uniref:D-arabinono-1,4-lactone oxidase n=1 Tax=Vibrio penaeicida TaxID=104609 RepID=UPI0027359EAD|nr:D-arabinono-1,4-lactone oxidase [Vibrio penaeicida]MDP2575867.1 D-arabinono-1,4-lactone oxidase [Vibrio penaeicida]
MKFLDKVKMIIFLLAAVFFIPSSYAFTSPPKTPTESAQKVRVTFTADKNPASIMPVRLLEGIEIWPASDESNITHYNVYWGDVLKNKLGLALAPTLAKIEAKKDGDVLVHEFPSDFKMEVGAIYILVCTANQFGEFCGKENNFEKITDPLLSIASKLSHVKKTVKKNQHLPGVSLMATCSDLICNGNETAESCPSDCGEYAQASFNFMVLCDESSLQSVYHPTSVEEIQSIVALAKRNGIRIKVSSGQTKNNTAGSASGIICTDGITMIMNKFDHSQAELGMALEMFEGIEVVNVASGTNLHELGEWLYERGKGLGYVHLGWRHASVAGAIGTSAHGSSPINRNILSHSVVSMDIVGADGKLKTYSRGTTGETDPDLWKSLLTHMGYFGIITRLKLEVQPATNTHVKITFHDEKELFEENKKGSVIADIKECDYGQYNWFPSLKQYLRTCGKTTTLEAEKNANNRLIFPYVDTSALSIEETMQAFQIGGAEPSIDTHQSMAYLRKTGWHITPPLVKTVNGELRYTTNAVGPTHRITSSKLIDNVGREMRQMDWEVAVPEENAQAAIEDIRKWANGLNNANRNMPVPLIGIFLRFSKIEDAALMAYTGAGNGFTNGTTAMHIEFPIFVPAGLPPEDFNQYMSPYEEAMNMLVTKYGARAHWGKNTHSNNSWIFELQRDNKSYGDYLNRYSEKIGQVDPNGMFANKFAKSIGIKYPNFTYPKDW